MLSNLNTQFLETFIDLNIHFPWVSWTKMPDVKTAS